MYLTVVINHDTGRLVWAAPGRDRKTVEKFLDLLGKDRCEQIELVSCDMAESIALAVSDRCPNAVRCVDPFHVIQLATNALDEIRREVWNQARRSGHKQEAKELKAARFALWKNERKLTERQRITLAQIQQTNKPLYRAYLISQQLREIYRVTHDEAVLAARRVARVGTTMSPTAIRETRQDDHRAASRDRSRDPARIEQRTDRASQYPAATDHPPRLRVPLPRCPGPGSPDTSVVNVVIMSRAPDGAGARALSRF